MRRNRGYAMLVLVIDELLAYAGRQKVYRSRVVCCKESTFRTNNHEVV